MLINGAQGGNVFWRVGSSATLGTSSSFTGDILAQASISLNTGATITCGAAWARTGAVTLDTNTISLCAVTGAQVPAVRSSGRPACRCLFHCCRHPPTAASLAAAGAVDVFVGNGGTLPLAFANLFNLSPAELGNCILRSFRARLGRASRRPERRR